MIKSMKKLMIFKTEKKRQKKSYRVFKLFMPFSEKCIKLSEYGKNLKKKDND